MSLAIGLANTPDDPQPLEIWLRGIGAPDGVPIDALIALRAAVRKGLEAVAASVRPPHAAVAALNRASQAGPSYARLESDALCYVALASPVEAFLAEVAADAITLVGGPQRPLVRRCDAPGCDRIFVASRPRQTWCSDRCGTRARVARHRAA
jgi:predicted RNA-binding Zn ribbon-like protein